MNGGLLAADLIISYLKHAMKLTELKAQAEAEGREVTMEDVKKLEAENDEKRKKLFG